MERPGTSLRTTEIVAGFKPRYSASCFSPVGSFLGGGIFFMELICPRRGMVQTSRSGKERSLSDEERATRRCIRACRLFSLLSTLRYYRDYPSAKGISLYPAKPCERGLTGAMREARISCATKQIYAVGAKVPFEKAKAFSAAHAATEQKSSISLLPARFCYHASVVTDSGSSVTSMALAPSWHRTVCFSPRFVSTRTTPPSGFWQAT